MLREPKGTYIREPPEPGGGDIPIGYLLDGGSAQPIAGIS